MPRVAIAMAVYDDERYLPLALGSLAAQTFRDFHVTVYDDGSRDGSAEIAERFADRLRIRVVRGPHLGRHRAKRAAWSLAADAPFLMALDSDVALPPDALARMVPLLEREPNAAAVSALARSFSGRRYGRAQAFLEDLFFRYNSDGEGNGRWIVGGCAMFRRSALEGVEVRSDLGEDNDLSEKLRPSWKLLAPLDLVAVHHGVPTTLGGVLRRFHRDGVRVRALLRAYPQAGQLGNLARLAPLPLAALATGGALLRSPGAAAGGLALVGAYLAAFLWASRRVPARAADRVAGALLFTFGNLGFAAGYLRESLRGKSELMREPSRPAE